MRAAVCDLKWIRNRADGLRQIARREGVTLYMVILTAFKVLLFRLSGQEDIIVGTTSAGRGHADLQRIIGMFVNTLAIRSRPGGHMTFRRFLEEVREQALGAFDNQEHPFEDLVDRLSITRDTSRNPVFDVLFSMLTRESAGKNSLDSGSLAVEPCSLKNNTAKFDLMLDVLDSGESQPLFVTFEYCSRLFKEQTVQRIISYFRRVVDDVNADAGVKLGEIIILSQSERKMLLFDFNATDESFPKDKTVDVLFEEQAQRTPDRGCAVRSAEHFCHLR